MGRADYLEPGDWNAMCSRCGHKFKASMLRRHWQGMMRCPRCWEPRQPQDFVKAMPDVQTPPWVQPWPADRFTQCVEYVTTSQLSGSYTPTLDCAAGVDQVLVVNEGVTICTLDLPAIAGDLLIQNFGLISRILNTHGITYTLQNMGGGVLLSAPVVSSLTPSSTTVTAGDTVIYTVALNIARCYSSTVTLESSDPTKATVPASVTVAAGASTATFDATTLAAGSTIITATLNGSVTATLAVDIPGQISTLTPDPAAVLVGGTVTMTATLAAAPILNKTVTLSSSDSAKVSVPASVVVLGGTDHSTFSASGVAPGTSTLTATLNGTATSSATTSPSILSITPGTASVLIGETVTLTVTLNGTAATNEIVTLSSADVTKVTVPASVTVLTGQSTATFSATGVAAGSSVVTGTLNGTATSTVTTAAYSATATVTFSAASGFFPYPGDWSSAVGGYDDLVMVAYDGTGTSFYRIAQDSGAYTTHSFPAAAPRALGVDEMGNVWSRPNAVGTPFYRTQPDDTQFYFDHTIPGNPAAPNLSDRDVGPDVISAQYVLSSINYPAHTCTTTARSSAAGTPDVHAKQYANVSGHKIYTHLAGGTHTIGILDRVAGTVTGIIGALAGLNTTDILVDGNADIYTIQSDQTVKRWDNTGTLLGTLTLSAPAGVSRFLVCITDTFFLWILAPKAGVGTDYWKVRTSDMTVIASGTLALHSGAPWYGAVGMRFFDQTSPVLFHTGGVSALYIGKMVSA